ncbi:MAG: glycerate kinase [Fidelibacterota bacterium]
MSPARPRDRSHLEEIFQAALKAVDASRCVTRELTIERDDLVIGEVRIPRSRIGRIWIAGAGKGAAFMARGAEQFLEAHLEDRYAGGLVVVKDGHTTELNRVTCREAGHPVPDARGERAAGELLDLLRKVGEGDLVLFLLSGGASALLPAPVEGIPLSDKIALTGKLLACGADIHKINVLRKHCSRIKGGRLILAAQNARWITLAISDVPGDSPESIGSGPTVGDPSTLEDCWRIIDKYNLKNQLQPSILEHLSRENSETPKPGDPLFSRTRYRIVARNADAVRGAVGRANELGYRVAPDNGFVTGNVEDVAALFHRVKRETASSLPKPFIVIRGGEPTVTVTGKGKGGRNTELALRVASRLGGKFTFLSAGTDGTDGPTDAAGAFVDETTLARARTAGMDPDDFLKRNDTYSFFRKLGDLLITGPTGTNVMDLEMVLVWE